MREVWGIGHFFYLIWYIIAIIQELLGLGTAYRKTKAGGDNGVALWGWLFVFSLAAVIPGLGFYFWRKHRDLNMDIEEDI